MNIGEVARRAGLPTKTIRYYEEIGLITPLRGPNGYRAFRESDLHKLAFLARARSLGFTIKECRTLLALYEDQSRSASDVKTVAQEHLARVSEKIRELEALEATIAHLIDACAGDHRPDCPILEDLSAPDEAASKPGLAV